MRFDKSEINFIQGVAERAVTEKAIRIARDMQIVLRRLAVVEEKLKGERRAEKASV